MEEYVAQLIDDIERATNNFTRPQYENELLFWMPDKEEDATAQVINLQEWTGIYAEMLPAESSLTDEQVTRLLNALIKMLNEFNWLFVLQFSVPERIQYNTIRDNFNQEAKIKYWHMGFFELCRPGTEIRTCALGEYCQCEFFQDLFKNFREDEELSPEEERDRELEWELEYLRKKHGRNFWKYYPYHLDKHFDDEKGEPFDYGFGDDDEDDEDNWWKAEPANF